MQTQFSAPACANDSVIMRLLIDRISEPHVDRFGTIKLRSEQHVAEINNLLLFCQCARFKVSITEILQQKSCLLLPHRNI
ncbi:hypothetical protein CXB77_12140 [Chromatium okenii]|jgi:hypothetical protein|uniref:Uncharacterized protein n=1 Tax=Chromatium okenii TaxID=61644 RepID=A0A2S7XMV2_9GAMM|nr:hypothetical protein CXB77_12140 [Chromatium okenii]